MILFEMSLITRSLNIVKWRGGPVVSSSILDLLATFSLEMRGRAFGH